LSQYTTTKALLAAKKKYKYQTAQDDADLVHTAAYKKIWILS
jgi:hypothetical protein